MARSNRQLNPPVACQYFLITTGDTAMKLKALTLTTLLAGSVPVYAGFMMGPMEDNAAAAFDTILEYADDTSATELQSQKESVDALRTELDTLMAAEEPDEEAIAEARTQLRDARHDLRDDVRDVVSENDELKTVLQEQRETAQLERAVTGYALHNDSAYESLTAAATDEQASQLEGNKAAMDSLRTEAEDARAAGATREDMRDFHEQMRTLASEQAEIVSDVLDANEELQSEFATAAEDFISEHRPPRHRRPE